jgi:hypothetical protein
LGDEILFGSVITDEKYLLSLHSTDKFDLAPDRLHRGDSARIDYLHLGLAREERRDPEVVQRCFQHNVVGTEFLCPHYWVQGIRLLGCAPKLIGEAGGINVESSCGGHLVA